MKLEKILFTDILPSDYNPRKISQTEMKNLTSNLKEFGLVDPIIINLKNNHIIGGHQRYTALKKQYTKEKNTDEKKLHLMRLGDIGWVFPEENLTIESEEHEKALNLALNKISGEWDYSKLSLLLSELKQNNFRTDLTGFTQYEIETYTIPSDLGLQFREIEDIKDGKISVNEEGELSEKTKDNEEITNTPELKEVSDVAVSSEEIEKIHKYKCPNCGHEW